MKTFLQYSYAHLNEHPTVMHTYPYADTSVFCNKKVGCAVWEHQSLYISLFTCLPTWTLLKNYTLMQLLKPSNSLLKLHLKEPVVTPTRVKAIRQKQVNDFGIIISFQNASEIPYHIVLEAKYNKTSNIDQQALFLNYIYCEIKHHESIINSHAKNIRILQIGKLNPICSCGEEVNFNECLLPQQS